MDKNDNNSGSYARIGTKNPGRKPVPILAPGIGTRISAASEVLGSRKNAYETMGVSSASLQRYIAEEVMPPFDVVAKLCAAAGVRFEWVAFAAEPMLAALETAPESHSQPLRSEELTMAIQLVEEALEGKTLEPAKRAELVGLVYEGLVEGLPEAKVLRWARAAAK